MSVPTARQIVMTYGWNATAYQILNRGMDQWLAHEVPAVVGYTRCGNALVAAGGPVCPPAAVPTVAAAFERFARQHGCGVCYVCCEERLRALFRGSRDHAAVAIGAQPVWDPRDWARVVGSTPTLRAQLHRARNQGVVIEAISPEASGNRESLGRIRVAWLHTRCLPSLRFLADSDVLAGIDTDRVALVARQGDTAVAYLIASPIALRNGYLIEQVVRAPRSPNGTSELLIDAAMRHFAAAGRTYCTLGLVALARMATPMLRQNPSWLRGLMHLARRHANALYGFRGLDSFRTKMAPNRWDSIYAIANEPALSFRTLFAVAEAFFGMSPWCAIGIGLVRAAARQLRQAAPRIAERMGAQAL